ncbi:MAG TPA: hypothetical protein VE338_14050, partial [Ktedonobacterales bacterium]|nr:hypothetical protein [Ktedonobacterales bacterium]
MLNVYRPVPRDLFAATPPVRSRRALRFFMTWYEAVAGAAVVAIMALLIIPIAARAPWMTLWLIAYLSYISVMLTIARAPHLRQTIHALASATAHAFAHTFVWLVYGVSGRPRASDDAADAAAERDARGLALIQVSLAPSLTAAALLFVVTLGRSYR